jgi:hypothetical protein
MNKPPIHSRVVAGSLLVVILPFCVPAQDAQTDRLATPAKTEFELKQTDSSRIAASTHVDDVGSQTNFGGAVKHSVGVDDILKMVQAAVSTEVIKLFIENSPIAYDLSATDIVALKEKAVPDDITSSMINRGALLRNQARQANKVYSQSLNRRYNIPDPESYAYFQQYYLFPRTLAAANQRLLSAYADLPPYSSRFYGPPAFWR